MKEGSPHYRLQPRRAARYWWVLMLSTSFLLCFPMVLNLLVPHRHVVEEAHLGMAGYPWRIELDLECEQGSPLAFGEQWLCGDTTVDSVIAEGGRSPERTLRRMVRAVAISPPEEDAQVVREGDLRLLIDDSSGVLGISREGSDDYEGLTMVAVISLGGNEAMHVSEKVWEALGGTELPRAARAYIANWRYSNERPELPWRLNA